MYMLQNFKEKKLERFFFHEKNDLFSKFYKHLFSNLDTIFCELPVLYYSILAP